ncbi:hypothetical protein F4809DRAFT_636470 [Biscogniauxia mediterranea]|nr:hypothetical protein F4809DRAFT_636470 [Biscogniauxia mediterranea]
MARFVEEKLQYTPISSDNEDSDAEFQTPRLTELGWRRRFYILFACSITIISLLVTGIVYKLCTFSCPSCTPGAEKPYSPAPVSYINRYLTSDPDTPKFMGKPRPELDEAWHNLLAGTMIRYSEEELFLANNSTSVRHIEGGYVGGLGISHSLHCLKRLKQYIHPDYYYNHEDQDWDELYSHVDHCLESLRQEVMCSADVNIYTLQWTPHSRLKPTVRVPQPHACVNWGALHKWMNERAARLDDMEQPPKSLYKGKETIRKGE